MADILESLNEKNLIWITMINNGYLHYTKNFLESMKKSNCSFTLVVYCIDSDLIQSLKGYDNCVCIDMNVCVKMNLSSDLKSWGDIDYKRITFAKLDVIKYTLQNSSATYIGYIDTDIVLFTDPSKLVLDTFAMNTALDMVFQCDENRGTCSNKHRCCNVCTGVAVFKNSSNLYSLLEYNESDVYTYPSDQHYINNSKLCNSKFVYETISQLVFLNGYILFQCGSDIPNGAQLIHFNYMIGNEKMFKMRMMNMWYIE